MIGHGEAETDIADAHFHAVIEVGDLVDSFVVDLRAVQAEIAYDPTTVFKRNLGMQPRCMLVGRDDNRVIPATSERHGFVGRHLYDIRPSFAFQ